MVSQTGRRRGPIVSCRWCWIASALAAISPLEGGRLRLAHEFRENLILAYGGSTQAEDISGAEFVDLNKLSLPSAAGVVPVSSLLLPWQKEVYLHPERLLHIPEAGEVLPKPYHRVRACGKAVLQDRLLQNHMGGLLLESAVATDPDGCILSGWLFGIKKPPKNDLPRQRMIFDRRRQNALEKRVRWVTLPSARLLRKRVLLPSLVWRGSGKDLEIFYFILRHDPVWYSRNCAGRRVPKFLVAKWLGARYLGRGNPSPDAHYRICLRVPGMGDLNTVDLTTAAHINLLRGAGLLPNSELLEHGRPVPLGDTWSGVYIDDWLLAKVCDTSAATVPSSDTARAEAALAATYVDVGPPEEVSTQYNQTLNFKSWGVLVRGGLGCVSCPPEVRSHIFWLACALVPIGWATKRILQQVQSLCAAAWIIKSEFLCVFPPLIPFR